MKTKQKFLTIFFYKDIGVQHLYKDVGSVPFGMAKYCGWESDFAYVNINGEIHDPEYEKFVNLIPVKNIVFPFISILWFLLWNVKKYDILNFYHLSKQHIFLILMAKLMNPTIKIYVKIDIGRNSFFKIMKRPMRYNLIVKFLSILSCLPDLCTVETKSYVRPLNKTAIYKGRIQYLPNGFWRDEGIPANLADKKENIILTVGRLGTPQKNTELLLNSFAEIPAAERKNWKLFLVGSYTQGIWEKAKEMIAKDLSLRGSIVFTGNIDDKKQLNQYYTRAAIFCLPSRWESFGIVLIEAIHHGCFPIVTDCCDAFYDILNQGKYGNIVQNENKSALIMALRKAIKNKEYVVNIGMQGKKHVDNNFLWESNIYRLQHYIEKL